MLPKPACLFGSLHIHLGMFVNLAICLLLLVHVIAFVPENNHYVLDMVDRLGNTFSPNWDTPADTRVNLYSPAEVLQQLQNSQSSWKTLSDDHTVSWIQEGAPIMKVKYLRSPHTYRDYVLNPEPDVQWSDLECTLQDNGLGPFQTPAAEGAEDGCQGMKDIMQRVLHVNIHFVVRSLRVHGQAGFPSCYQWLVTQNFEFGRTGIVRFYLHIRPAFCGAGASDHFGTTYDNTSVLLLACVVASLFLRGRVVWKRLRLHRVIRLQRSSSSAHALESLSPQGNRDWECSVQSLHSSSTGSSGGTVRTRMDFLQDAVKNVTMQPEETKASWLTLGLVADLFCVASMVTNLVVYHSRHDVGHGVLTFTRFSMGMACFLEFLAFVGHLENQPWFFLLIKSLRLGTPMALRFIIGCIPLFLGYACFGTIVFGNYAEGFIALDKGSVTLFAVMNGDVVHDNFQAIYPSTGAWLQFLSRAFLYSFIILHIYAVLNVFLAIMEDTYFQIKSALINDLVAG